MFKTKLREHPNPNYCVHLHAQTVVPPDKVRNGARARKYCKQHVHTTVSYSLDHEERFIALETRNFVSARTKRIS